MKLAAKGILITVILFVFSFLFIKSPAVAQAQVQPQNMQINSYAAPNTNPDVPNNLHTWSQNVLIEVISAMTCQIAGVDPTSPTAKCLGVDQKTGKIGYVENGKGAIGLMGNLISMTLTPPIHTHDYIAYLSNNFGIAKSTYAAPQTGFNSLSPIMNIWITFRNLAYLLFVIVFIVIGLGIMLRLKVDPRTVMTIQNQIPKIIVGLLLVTFSFAIAGLLIDFMWIMIYFLINVLTSADPKLAQSGISAGSITSQLNTPTLNFVNNLYDNGVGTNNGIVNITTKAAFSVGALIVNIFTGSGFGGSTINSGSVIDTLANPIGSILSGVFGWVFGFIGGLLAYLIVLIAILWSLFRLWFALIEAYVFILADVILAPFWIITGLLPGGAEKMGFGAWMRDILGNLAAFPAAIGMFLLGRILIDAFGKGGAEGQFFTPPLIANPANSGLDTFGAIIALGIIWTTPHVVKITKAAFKAPKIDLGPIGAAVGVGAAVPGRVVGAATNAAIAPHYGKRGSADENKLLYPEGWRKILASVKGR